MYPTSIVQYALMMLESRGVWRFSCFSGMKNRRGILLAGQEKVSESQGLERADLALAASSEPDTTNKDLGHSIDEGDV